MAHRVLLALSIVLLVAACAPAVDGPSAPVSSTTEPTATETATPDTSAQDDEAAVLAAYFAYWDATVALFAGEADESVYDDVATGLVVESNLAEARYYEEYDLVLAGAPTFSRETVSIDGDSAVVLACVDSSGWKPADFDGEIVGDTPDVLPGGLVLERTDGTWWVTDSQAAPESFTC